MSSQFSTEKTLNRLRQSFHLPHVRRMVIWVIGLVVTSLVLGGITWFTWHQFGAQAQIPASNLLSISALGVLNLTLALASYDREPYACFLLLGATIIGELLTILFLYLI